MFENTEIFDNKENLQNLMQKINEKGVANRTDFEERKIEHIIELALE